VKVRDIRKLLLGSMNFYIFTAQSDFRKEIFDDTNGTFHVLALVDGERVRVESIQDTSLFYVANSWIYSSYPIFWKVPVINEGVGKLLFIKLV